MDDNDKKPIVFEELYPDYPLKKVKPSAYLPGFLLGLATLGGLAAISVGLLYILSEVQPPVPKPTAPAKPLTEAEMMHHLPPEKLYEIAVNCISVKDGDCAKKVFQHIMSKNPDFIEKSILRKKMMSEASAL